MHPASSQTRGAKDNDIQKVGECIIEFLRRYPDDVDALNEATLPYAFLTMLRKPRRSNLGTVYESPDNECSPRQVDAASSCVNDGANNADDADTPAASPECEAETTRTGRHGTEDNNVEAADILMKISSGPPDSNVNQDETADSTGDEVLSREYCCQPLGENIRHVRTRAGQKGSSPTSERRKSAKRIKIQRRLKDAGHRSMAESSTRRAEAGTDLTASESIGTQEMPTVESRIGVCIGPYDDLVSTWTNDPEIIRISKHEALARYREPKQELQSYIRLIASIGSADVQRSFAVGVMQVMHNARFSFKVPTAPSHLQNIEDADTMQCFWRAAYRSQVNGSLVSFGVILHRRSLTTLRNCYFKAMAVIKSTMKRKGIPGHTKAAIARGILLDTVFPGSDKESLKRMSDRLKNDVTRARNYCKLIEYYGSSGILGLLPQSLTDTRMRDFTDAEFGVFLDLVGRLRLDLEVERSTGMTVEAGEYSRMRIWGRIIDMIHTGLRPLESDCDFIQKETNVILNRPQNALEGAGVDPQAVDHAGVIMHRVADCILSRSEGQEGREDNALAVGSVASRYTRREADLDICNSSEVHGSAGRIQEEH